MSDKTEKPTPRRLQRARQDGDIAKSAHVSAAVSGVLWWLLLVFEAPRFFAALVRMTESVLSVDAQRPFAWQFQAVLGAMLEPCQTALVMLGFGLMAALVPELAQTRGLVSLKRIAPDFKHINPLQGLKNLFGLKMLFDTALMLVQFAILIDIGFQETMAWLSVMKPSYSLTPSSQLALIAHAHAHLLALVALSQLAPAAADYALQHVLYKRRLRMDKEELKREYRDEQGDPHVKGRRRALHQQLNQ